jgi:hypothetical protein
MNTSQACFVRRLREFWDEPIRVETDCGKKADALVKWDPAIDQGRFRTQKRFHNHPIGENLETRLVEW